MITVDASPSSTAGFTAVDAVTFTAAPGRVTGFLGPNGARKSTTMRIMVGLTTASQGTVTVAGRNYRDLPNPGRQVGDPVRRPAQRGRLVAGAGRGPRRWR